MSFSPDMVADGMRGGKALPGKSNGRSYQLDVMKLFFCGIVFLSHTDTFIGENTGHVIPHAAGFWAVFFFFIVSGMLMVNSQAGQSEELVSPAVAASEYVTKRLKALLNPYLSALFLHFVVFCFFILIHGERFFLVDVVRIIPQMLFLSSTALDSFLLNSPAWYISAMLIVMLPFCYLLKKDKDSYIYIYMPLTAIISYVWCFQRENHYFLFYEYHGILSAGIIFSIMGLSFGAVSWYISDRLRKHCGKRCRNIATAAELILYGIIFAVWFSPRCTAESAYSVMLLLPIAAALSFSEVSYLSALFRAKIFRHLAPVSLAVYLNHICAWRIVNELYLGRSYRFCLFAMIVFTAAICPVYFLTMRFFHWFWNWLKSRC